MSTVAIDFLPLMLDLSMHRADLEDRMASAKALVTSGELTVGAADDISRETRGLAVVLVFAAYENMLKTLTTSVLEYVAGSRAKNRRLKPGFKLIATHNKFQGLFELGPKHLWTGRGLDLMETAMSTSVLSVHANVFPMDGSFMKQSQVSTICTLFDFGDPSVPLGRTWSEINAVVGQRNAIAHGQRRADEVGRTYSYLETLALIENWRASWLQFIDWVEGQCQTSDFFLLPR